VDPEFPPEPLWGRLNGRLWHATSLVALRQIFGDGRIEPSAQSKYPESFSQKMNGISLFDFGPTSRHDWGQYNNWSRWFGHEWRSNLSVWLQINRDSLRQKLWDAEASRIENKRMGYPKFIPGVEACHVGPIPFNCIQAILLVPEQDRASFLEASPNRENLFEWIERFKTSLPPVEKHPMEIAVEKRRAALRGERSSH